MALIKNDIQISDEEFKTKLEGLEQYIDMMPQDIKYTMLENNSFLQTYSSTFFKTLNKGKEGTVNFYNLNDQQISDYICSLSKNLFKIESSNYKKINNESDTRDYTNHFIDIYQKVCDYVSEVLQYFNREVKYKNTNSNELSSTVLEICTNNLSDETKHSFANDFDGYMDYYSSTKTNVDEMIKDYFKQLQAKQTSNPQL